MATCRFCSRSLADDPPTGEHGEECRAHGACVVAAQSRIRELEADRDRWQDEALAARAFLRPDGTTHDVCTTSGGWCSWGPRSGSYRAKYAAARAANEDGT